MFFEEWLWLEDGSRWSALKRFVEQWHQKDLLLDLPKWVRTGFSKFPLSKSANLLGRPTLLTNKTVDSHQIPSRFLESTCKKNQKKTIGLSWLLCVQPPCIKNFRPLSHFSRKTFDAKVSDLKPFIFNCFNITAAIFHGLPAIPALYDTNVAISMAFVSCRRCRAQGQRVCFWYIPRSTNSEYHWILGIWILWMMILMFSYL